MPDIATSVPTPTGGGKIYTFHLKRGVKFGPPLDREVTSKDVRYAFERIANPSNGAQYGFYYSVIAGFDAFGAGKAKTISGIATPDEHTIVFHLTRPVADFLYRVALPAAGPIPAEVAKCFEGKARSTAAPGLDRPVHDRGRRCDGRVVVQGAEADQRLRRPDAA